MPVALSVLIIFGSLAFILWYFVWLPRAIHLRDAEATAPSPNIALPETVPHPHD